MRLSVIVASILLLSAVPVQAGSGDIDGNGSVDSADVRILRQSLAPGATPLSGPAFDEANVAPLDGPDQVVDERDLAVLLRAMRECPVVTCDPSLSLPAQQVWCYYDPTVPEPSRPGCLGPRIRFDQSHDNLHQLAGFYWGFWKLLSEDGYEVRDLADGGPYESFDGLPTAHFGDILVIAGARAGSGIDPQQVGKIVNWIASGGSLLLTTDHYDFDLPVRGLAAALGVTIDVGPTGIVTGDVVPNAESPLAQGVTDVSRNGGAGLFSAPTLPPETSHEVVLFLENSEVGPGAALVIAVQHGAGRAVVVGDGAVFSSQVYYTGLVGLPGNPDNERLLLNVMHWLDGSLGETP